MNKYFKKEYIWMANKYLKRFSKSLAIREMQMKNYNEIPLRIY